MSEGKTQMNKSNTKEARAHVYSVSGLVLIQFSLGESFF